MLGWTRNTNQARLSYFSIKIKSFVKQGMGLVMFSEVKKCFGVVLVGLKRLQFWLNLGMGEIGFSGGFGIFPWIKKTHLLKY